VAKPQHDSNVVVNHFISLQSEEIERAILKSGKKYSSDFRVQLSAISYCQEGFTGLKVPLG
jgi:hypothetical protein